MSAQITDTTVQITDAFGRLAATFETDSILAGATAAYERLRWGLGGAVVTTGTATIVFGKIGDELVDLISGQSFLPGCDAAWNTCTGCGMQSSSVRRHATVGGRASAMLCRGCFDHGENGGH